MKDDIASLGEILQRLGSELAHLGAIGCRVEDAVSRLISQAEFDVRPARTVLQEIDLFVQISQDLNAFLLTLADIVPSDCEVGLCPAIDVLKLERLRKFLGGVEEELYKVDGDFTIL